MYKNPTNKEKSNEALKFFEWAFSPAADKIAADLEYVDIPPNVEDFIKKNVWTQIAR
jgi:ABC-type phosphate transport system substrate-binding protein